MLQQYQQQPDYTTPYGGGGGIGYGAQPDAGYFNYGASDSSWYGSPSPVGADHSQNMVSVRVLVVFFVFFSRSFVAGRFALGAASRSRTLLADRRARSDL